MPTRNASYEFRVRADQIDTQQTMANRDFSRGYEAAQELFKDALNQKAFASNQVQLTEEDLQLSRVRFEGDEARTAL